MITSKEIKSFVTQGFITQEQADKILLAEQSKKIGSFWKILFGIAGSLIGLGIILLIASNWQEIPDGIKLFFDFAIFAAILYGVYWSFLEQKKYLLELFLVLSFLMVGGTIGLISQIFNLDGGWQSFALSWSLLSLPFVLFSRLLTFNIIWLLLFSIGIDWEPLLDLLKLIDSPLMLTIFSTILFGLIYYLSKALDEVTNEKIMLMNAISMCSLLAMYFIAIFCGGNLGLSHRGKNDVAFEANVFVFLFLAIRIGMAFLQKNMDSFKNNALLTEFYILWFFVSRFGDLFVSGLGFVCGGVLLLCFIYFLKKTSKHIKAMEVFSEK